MSVIKFRHKTTERKFLYLFNCVSKLFIARSKWKFAFSPTGVHTRDSHVHFPHIFTYVIKNTATAIIGYETSENWTIFFSLREMSKELVFQVAEILFWRYLVYLFYVIANSPLSLFKWIWSFDNFNGIPGSPSILLEWNWRYALLLE